MKITTLHKFDTEYPADSIEWCPNDGYRSYFACGTYFLEDKNVETSTAPCRRKGTIIIFKFKRQTNEFEEVFRCQTAAILDMKWLPSNNSTSELTVTVPILATANALGEIDIYSFESERLELRSSIALDVEQHNLLALSLDWDSLCNNSTATVTTTNKRRLLVSDSKGEISLLECYNIDDGNEYKIEKINIWQAHNFEAWTCSFDKWDSNLVYTGGDDIMVHVYDLRTYERVLTNRSHAAGVTSILSHSNREKIILTGSYDERLRIFDTRSMRNPMAEINLQGGIWRIKPDPYQGDLILTACMYKNFSIVRLPLVGNDETSLELLSVYNEHESICYGADWCLDIEDEDEDGKKDLCMATCSFYDKKLCVCSVKD